MPDPREDWKQKIRAAKAELKTAGPCHRRDLEKHIRRMEKELLIYDFYHRKTAVKCSTSCDIL